MNIPEGWKLVPTKHEGRAGLTDAMMRAFYAAFEANKQRGDFERLNAGYNAMLDAFPSPPAQIERAMTEAVDAAMVEMANISPPLRRSECERLIRAAMTAAPAQTERMLTDEQIYELAFRHCYATTAAAGFIFDRERGHMLRFARALLAAAQSTSEEKSCGSS